MRLIRDLAATAGDVLRLSSDLMRCKIEMEKKIITRIINRLTMYLAVFLVSIVLGGIGVGFVLYAVFVLLAAATASAAAAGLIMGFTLLVVAIAIAIMGRSLLSRS